MNKKRKILIEAGKPAVQINIQIAFLFCTQKRLKNTYTALRSGHNVNEESFTIALGINEDVTGAGRR